MSPYLAICLISEPLAAGGKSDPELSDGFGTHAVQTIQVGLANLC